MTASIIGFDDRKRSRSDQRWSLRARSETAPAAQPLVAAASRQVPRSLRVPFQVGHHGFRQLSGSDER